MQILDFIKKYYMDFLYICKFIIIQVFQTIGIFIIAYINDRPWECIFAISGYITCRMVFKVHYDKKKQKKTPFHFKSTWACTLSTWGIFYVFARIFPELSVSLIIQPLLGFNLAYQMFRIEEILSKEVQSGNSN